MTPKVPNVENLLTKILEATPDIVLIYNLQTRAVAWANHRSTDLWGYPPPDLKSMGDHFLSALTLPADIDQMSAGFHELHDCSDDEVISFNVRLVKANGKTGWFRMRNKIFSRGSDGRVEQVISICTDVTEEMTVQMKLQQEEVRFRAIFENTSDLNFFIDTEYNILSVNRTAVEHVLQLSGREVRAGDNLLEAIPYELQAAIVFKINEALEGSPSQLLQSHVNLNGQTVWYKSRYYAIRDAQDRLIGISISCRDVSELVNANLILEKQNRQLKEIARMNAHEIRKPLTNILGLIHLVELEHEPQFSGETNLLLDHLKQASSELDDVIRRIVHTASARN